MFVSVEVKAIPINISLSAWPLGPNSLELYPRLRVHAPSASTYSNYKREFADRIVRRKKEGKKAIIVMFG